jgi:hypothetical protein
LKFSPEHYRLLNVMAYLRSLRHDLKDVQVVRRRKTRRAAKDGLAALIPEPDEEVLARAREVLGQRSN